MKNTNRIYIMSLMTLFLFLTSCGESQIKTKSNPHYRHITGEAQGTTYSITFRDSTGLLFSNDVADSIFDNIDQSLSVWNKESTISLFNQSDSMVISDTLFLSVFFRALEMEELTGGAFTPKIMPLVQAWGFGPDGVHPKGDIEVDSLMFLVHTPFEINVIEPIPEAGTPNFLIRKMTGQAIDVNGIAKGYTVDILADYLTRSGIGDFMVEVGGEIAVSGENAKGEKWHIGIDKPLDLMEDRALQAVIELNNRSMATSGSYRKFYEEGGKRYSHTVDPETGRPVVHNLLSTTVFAPNCANADALATAFMVMGVEKTQDFLKQHPELQIEVYLIFEKDGALQTYISPGLEESLKEV